MVFLELHDVIKLYKPENELLQIPALRGIDLTIDKSDLITVIGPSGSGKSTLLNIIGGLDTPTSGKIIMDGVGLISNLRGKKLQHYRQEIVGFVYQYPDRNILAGLSALENITYPMKIHGKLARGQMKTRALELMELLGLKGKEYHKLGQLSGGEAQRVSIAIALANKPKLLLADEPTGELDSKNTFKIIDFFKDIQEEHDTTLLVVTHDIRFAKMTKLTYYLQDGRIHGFYRATQAPKMPSLSLPESREYYSVVDRFGNVMLPTKLLTDFKIDNEVAIKGNYERKAIEIISSAK